MSFVTACCTRRVDESSATVALDPFLKKLIDMLRSIDSDPSTWPKRQLHLSVNRSNYLMHHGVESQSDVDREVEEHLEQVFESLVRRTRIRPLQVEFNTISAGAGSLSNQTSEMHRFIVERYMKNATAPSTSGASDSSSFAPTPLRLRFPPNPVIANITSAMSHAHKFKE
jgi:hypothetical protein